MTRRRRCCGICGSSRIRLWCWWRRRRGCAGIVMSCGSRTGGCGRRIGAAGSAGRCRCRIRCFGLGAGSAAGWGWRRGRCTRCWVRWVSGRGRSGWRRGGGGSAVGLPGRAGWPAAGGWIRDADLDRVGDRLWIGETWRCCAPAIGPTGPPITGCGGAGRGPAAAGRDVGTRHRARGAGRPGPAGRCGRRRRGGVGPPGFGRRRRRGRGRVTPCGWRRVERRGRRPGPLPGRGRSCRGRLAGSG